MIAIMTILVYPIIQHAIKHYSYLEILSLWSIAYLIQVIFNFRKNMRKSFTYLIFLILIVITTVCYF